MRSFGSFQAKRCGQARQGPQRPSGTPAYLYRPLRRPGPLMLGPSTTRRERSWSRAAPTQRRHPENLATRPTPTPNRCGGRSRL
jgi:hypothetical protein